MKKSIFLALGIIISAVFLYFAIKGASAEDLIRRIENIRYEYLIISQVLLFMNFYVRGFLLQKLLSHLKYMSSYNLFKGVTICALFNNVFPFKLGEVAKTYYIGKTQNISFFSIFSSVITERMLDIIILSCCFLGTFLYVGFEHADGFEGINELIILMMFAIAILGLVFIYWLSHKKEAFIKLIHVLLGKVLNDKLQNWIIAKLSYFLDGIYNLNSIRDVAYIFFLSIIAWMFTYFHFLFGLIAIGIDVDYFFASLVLIGFVNLSAALPASPGMLGTLQFACVLALQIVVGSSEGEVQNQAIVFSGWVWASNFFIAITFGLYYMITHKIRFKGVSKMKIN